MNTFTIIALILTCLSMGSIIVGVFRSIATINQLKRKDAIIRIETNNGKIITFNSNHSSNRSAEEFVQSVHELFHY